MGTHDDLPRITLNDMELMYKEDVSDCDTLTVKGTLHRPPELAGYVYRVEMGIPTQKLDHICDFLTSLPHENIVKVYGRGEDFILTSFWNETLNHYLRRVELEMKEQEHRSCIRCHRRRDGTEYADYVNLWRHVAVPVTKAISFLHAENVTLGGALDLTTIVVNTQDGNKGEGLMPVPSQLYLRDFSKAQRAAVTEMDQLYSTELLAEDIFQLGAVLSEISLIQPLPPGEATAEMDAIIDMCCHPDPCLRPSVRRVEKTMLAVLRHPDVRRRMTDHTPSTPKTSMTSTPLKDLKTSEGPTPSKEPTPSEASPPCKALTLCEASRSNSSLSQQSVFQGGWRRLFVPTRTDPSRLDDLRECLPALVDAEEDHSTSSSNHSDDSQNNHHNNQKRSTTKGTKNLRVWRSGRNQSKSASYPVVVSQEVNIIVTERSNGGKTTNIQGPSFEES